ncbi:hypothetical protein Clacol_005694 [Clathrus columnatus]|uniref:Major facilitator superfamily (MFS) profile domain-containing protein n=1 Tax=Clathrus columnatus TaxID=1419009 RepID=A0AAV5AA14_9AGAM|nr:hypothetical protein Clacol_005694 [Clathrus columnatus]
MSPSMSTSSSPDSTSSLLTTKRDDDVFSFGLHDSYDEKRLQPVQPAIINHHHRQHQQQQQQQQQQQGQTQDQMKPPCGNTDALSLKTDVEKTALSITSQPSASSFEVVMQGEAVNPIYVEFMPGDVRNPRNASRLHKWTTTIIACSFTILAAGAGSSIALGFPSMLRDLHGTEEEGAATLSLFGLGFGVVPLLTAPLSEDLGRRPLFIASIIIFALIHVVAAEAKNMSTVILARFIAGAAGSTGATVAAGVVADIWAPSDRGAPMSLFALSAVGVAGLAPTFAGLIEQNPHLQWRWIQWLNLICSGAYAIVVLLFFNETRGDVILTREAHKLRKETGDTRYRARVEDERTSLRQLITTSCTRPLYLLATEPIVLSISLWIGVAWGVLYSQLESIGLVFQTLYQFNSAQVGLAFLPMSRNVKRIGPEARLYAAMVAAVLFPVGCFIYAWTALHSVHAWIGPMCGIFTFFVALFIMYLASFTYLADSYGIYASSALAGQSLCRNIMATIFPLFTTKMYARLPFQWASTIFACLATLLAVIPFILFWKGPQIRARSQFANKMLLRESQLLNPAPQQSPTSMSAPGPSKV